jgi:hypothetical protein
MRLALLRFALLALLVSSCGNPYGEVGGADATRTIYDLAGIAGIIEGWQGLWYSHYGQRRLDGYIIGTWENIKTVAGDKLALFPGFDPDNPKFLNAEGRAVPANLNAGDYFILYDDTVYGEGEDGGAAASWGFGFMGIVRAVNVFNGDEGTGAVIIEYLDGAYPRWEPDLFGPPPLPFFGIYYRVLNSDCIQMANASDLAALAAGEKHYTETASLEEAAAKNNAENSDEFVSWGVVIPQDREK